MPANIRVKCISPDCKFLNGVHCSSAEIEFDPRRFCLTYSPVETDSPDEHDELEDEELEEESWEDLEDDEEEDDEESLLADEED